MVIEFLKAFFFGIVEGITEWLPISSTGHMIILDEFVNLNVSETFYSTFLVTIQLGAIMAVIILFFRKLNPFAPSKDKIEKKETWGIWAKVVIGSIPPAIVGLLLDDWLEDKIMNNPDIAWIVVASTLIVYGILFIILERRNKRLIKEYKEKGHGRHAWLEYTYDNKELDESSIIADIKSFEELSFKRAFLIGIFEALSVIPGTSRSGAIILGSMFLGTSRTIAAEFAFFLAIPIMFGWSFIKFVKHGFGYTGMEWAILGIGMVTAFVVSIFVIKFLISYIKTNDFTAFGIYRIILGIIVIVFFGTRALGIF